MAQFKKIICPVDFDQNSLRALRLAAELARENKATLYVLHVVALPPGPEVALPFGRMEAAAKSRLEEMIRRKAQIGVRYEIRIMMGDAGVEILRAAKQLKAKLIVMATHGRKGLHRLILGSIAEQVIREAPCPVLTVSPRCTLAAAASAGDEHARRRSAPKQGQG